MRLLNERDQNLKLSRMRKRSITNLPTIRSISGISTPGTATASPAGNTTDLREIGVTRNKLLQLKLSGVRFYPILHALHA